MSLYGVKLPCYWGVRYVWVVLSAIFAVLSTLAGTSPTDAETNISAWLRVLGVEEVPCFV
jgi:hypothetical protein